MIRLVLALSVLFPGGPARAAPGADAVGIPIAYAQSVLEAEAGGFAQAWGAGDAQALGRVMNAGGIRLHLPGEEHMLIQPRQAQAALRSFLEKYAGGEARVTRASLAGGDSQKGFAEIRWRTRAKGIGEPVTFTLFVAFSRDAEAWRVTEIRVFL